MFMIHDWLANLFFCNKACAIVHQAGVGEESQRGGISGHFHPKKSDV